MTKNNVNSELSSGNVLNHRGGGGVIEPIIKV